MTDANGLPLSLVVAGANTHDIKLVADTLDTLQTGGLAEGSTSVWTKAMKPNGWRPV
ncbi:hypothetical protein [Escherichia coli]|uniref:hypothetical protein n=1 Tax=Escherichia coli TaxID=562 RepID=UPI0024DF9D40|nr:hypothetical protein [Escherichia coli]